MPLRKKKLRTAHKKHGMSKRKTRKGGMNNYSDLVRQQNFKNISMSNNYFRQESPLNQFENINTTQLNKLSPTNDIKQKINQMKEPFTFLGKGSYGAILTPPLPNKNKLANSYGVTKIYVKRPSTSQTKQFKEFVNETANLQDETKKRYNYHVYNYFNDYKLKNIYPKLTERNKAGITRFYKNNENSLLYPIAFPNLGLSFFDAVHEGYTAPSEVDSYLVEQIIECIKIIKTVTSKQFIHGDIREMNMMLDIDNLKMTIIDFDFLLPMNHYFDRMYRNFPSIRLFYPHPPECLFNTTAWKKIKYALYKPEQVVKKMIRDTWYQTLEERKQKNTQTIHYIYSQFDIDDSYVDAMYRFFKENRNAEDIGETLFEKVSSQFIDSYGLAYSISYLFFGNYPIYEKLLDKTTWNLEKYPLFEGMWRSDEINSSPIRKYFKDVLLPNMLHSDYRQRWTVDKAIDEILKMFDPNNNNESI